MHRISSLRALTVALGLLGGAVAATAVVAAVATDPPPAEAPPAVFATHLSPALTLAGEAARLRYDIYCPLDDPAVEVCDPAGSVFIRRGHSGPFTKLALRRELDGPASRFFVRVPAEIAGDPAGYSYYAVVGNRATGAETTLPAGGGAAPHRSLPLRSPVTVALGAHAFGTPRPADARVASAAWGDGPADAGLEQGPPGPDVTPIGASSFDVSADGTVTILDEAHRRALRFHRGAAEPVAVPLAVNGTIADLAVAPDGTMHVLETVAPGGGNPVVRTFASDGTLLREQQISEPSASRIRVGTAGPVVFQQPSGQWIATDGGSGGGDGTAGVTGAVGMPTASGPPIVVYRVGNELRVAELVDGMPARSWRITSDTPMAEVQLAEPAGDRLAVVLRLYTDSQARFGLVVLDGNGIVEQHSLAAADWAETAPASRFRLVGSSLYQLGSTPEGVFVDRFDLGVN